MDSEFWVRYLLAEGQSNVRFIDNLLGHFRLHEVSKTMSNRDAFHEENCSLLKQLYRSAFGTLPSTCCESVTSREDALQGVLYNTSRLNQGHLKSYLLQYFAHYCRDRISNIDRYALIGHSLLKHPIRSPSEYRFIAGTILFPGLHRWYKSLTT